MVLKSYAKINLSLYVYKKLKSGFHNIYTIYSLINLHDKIYVKKIKNQRSDKISFIGPFSKHVSRENNSIIKILDAMRKNNLIEGFYSIKVRKQIPGFSGFGGGTSNAAFLLKYLSKKKIEKKIFSKLTKAVGTDLALFFYNQGCQENLKFVSELYKKYKLYFLTVFPMIKSSTKKVYLRVTKYSKPKILLKKNLSSRKNFINYLEVSKNDLQLIVEKEHPAIRKLLLNIKSSNGCYFSRMTGSGSVCYGLFKDKYSSKVALQKLRKKYPKFWFSIAKTI